MDRLNNNINILQEKTYTCMSLLTGFPDISKSYLPDEEIAVNIIKNKNPSLTDDQARSIVKGAKDIGNTQSGGTQSSGTQSISEQASSLKSQVYPLPSSNVIYEEIKNIKNSVRESVMLFVYSQKEIIKDLGKMIIKTANSISGAAILIVPPSFNVPGAISLVMLVVDGLNQIITKVMEIISFLGPMEKLIFLVPKELFESITLPINIFLESLISIIGKIASIRGVIDSLIGQLLSILNPTNLANLIQNLIDEIAKKVAELMRMKQDNESLSKIQSKEKEINDLQKRLDELRENKGIPPNTKNGEFPNTLSNDFLDTLKDVESEIKNLSETIYDVTLPDGTIIQNVSLDTIEELKNKFNVVFKD